MTAETTEKPEAGFPLSDGLDRGRLQVVTDHIAERLDELADLTAVWKRHRESGRNPQHTRAAILNIAREMTLMIDADMAFTTREV